MIIDHLTFNDIMTLDHLAFYIDCSHLMIIGWDVDKRKEQKSHNYKKFIIIIKNN